MLKSRLGFGMMRLPVKNGDPTDFDYEQLNAMVDAFMEAGYTYFDTSYVYHNGKSEEAVRKAVVERHPRDSFTVATKFPTFILQEEGQIETIFEEQRRNLGVETIDYYLLHNIQTVYYDGVDGKGGVVKTCHLFDHAKKWLEDGKIRHLGFSFHSSAKLLDRVLAEHPEVEFVQIPFNYIDCESQLVQAMDAYEVIRKHGKQAVFMEPVKGGGLAMMPEEAADMLRKMDPEASIASWAIRYAGSFEGVICNLSGMSTLEQVKDNIRTVQTLEPLTEEEKKALHDVVEVYKNAGPVGADLSRFEGAVLHGVPVSAIMEAYNMVQLQPDPGFSDDNNYLKNAIMEESHRNFADNLPRETILLKDGTDATEEVYKAYEWLRANTF